LAKGLEALSTAAAAVSTAAAAAESAAATAAATTTAVATTATTTAAATTATGAIFAGLGFVDSESAAVMLLAVQSGNRRLGFLIRTHLNESEALAATGFPIGDDFGALHGAVLRKKLLQV
jgi:hypothetical protein